MKETGFFLIDDGGGNRPQPRQQRSLLPWDPSDGDGQVYTVMPPDQYIPPVGTDPAFMQADFNGVTIDGEYRWDGPPAIVGSAIVMTSGRWSGLRVPFISGANTTPPTMLMTPMAIRYPREVQDCILTLHAERSYGDFITAPEPWEAPETYTPAQIVDWCRYVNTWGFRNVIWRGDPNSRMDAMFHALFDAGVVGYYIDGEEVDSKTDADTYFEMLDEMNAFVKGTVPLGAHFTANGDRQMSYPIGAPREYFLPDWSPFNGRVHLMLQSCGINPDNTLTSAGRQTTSASYYARQRVNLGLEGGSGHPAPDCRVVLFETMATAQLYGLCDEVTGVRRSLEMFFSPSDDPRIPPMAGSGNGLWWVEGSPIIRPQA